MFDYILINTLSGVQRNLHFPIYNYSVTDKIQPKSGF